MIIKSNPKQNPLILEGDSSLICGNNNPEYITTTEEKKDIETIEKKDNNKNAVVSDNIQQYKKEI